MPYPDTGALTGRIPGASGLEPATSPRTAASPSPGLLKRIHQYRYPVRRKLQCCFFWTANAQKNNAPAYVTAASRLLDEHNLELDVCPGVEKTAAHTLPFNALVDISHEEELRNLAHKAHYHEGRIPVIFCRFAGALGGESDTLGYLVRLENWLPFILINVDKTSEDGVTLLHEIGHASDCGHVKSKKGDLYPNFMSYPPPTRTGILRNQVIRLAKSYFARNA
ncbi:M3 family oligoendopeptidase [Thiorhodococcus minor]|uniref:M3 family oligoendopeptidase n=1 Tax=Thiorhodococcus minor TaxID=57489 RepID=A0A6M0K4Y8_9GAMM|nr:M3 family oligoendopeptidase [Thiorhodococcus minor]NEV63983.1 M3 family oligoendopeptidase [Thiorhodococcus minor]